MTFDTAGILGYPLFGDTTNPAPLGVSISYAAPRHGFLIPDHRLPVPQLLRLQVSLPQDLVDGRMGDATDIGFRGLRQAPVRPMRFVPTDALGRLARQPLNLLALARGLPAGPSPVPRKTSFCVLASTKSSINVPCV